MRAQHWTNDRPTNLRNDLFWLQLERSKHGLHHDQSHDKKDRTWSSHPVTTPVTVMILHIRYSVALFLRCWWIKATDVIL